MRVAPKDDLKKRIEQTRQQFAHASKYGHLLYEPTNPGKNYKQYHQIWPQKKKVIY